MKFDTRLVTGIFVGLLVGLHYYSILAVYVPILMIVTLIMVLSIVKR